MSRAGGVLTCFWIWLNSCSKYQYTLGITVRPEPVEGQADLSTLFTVFPRSWFDKALLSEAETCREFIERGSPRTWKFTSDLVFGTPI